MQMLPMGMLPGYAPLGVCEALLNDIGASAEPKPAGKYRKEGRVRADVVATIGPGVRGNNLPQLESASPCTLRANSCIARD